MDRAELQELLKTKPPATAAASLSILLYGPPGAGKTYFAGTAADHPKTSPVFWIDIEGGTRTIADKTDIDVFECRSVEDLKKAGNTLEKSPGVYKCKVIDSLSELQKLDMTKIMRTAKMKNDNIDEEVPSPREWHKSQLHIRDVVRFFRDLPGHTIFITHSSDKENDAGITNTMPSLPGKLAAEIAGFVDIVGFISAKPKTVMNKETKKQEKRIVRTILFESNGTHIAKDRTDKLRFIDSESPTVPMLWDAIYNN